MEARKVIAKIIVGIMAAACYQPEPRPETAADWTVTRVFAGQQDGQAQQAGDIKAFFHVRLPAAY